MRAVLFGVDNCVKSGMFRCNSLGMGLVHRSISFRWLTRDRSVNKSRFGRFVARKEHGLTGCTGGSPMMRRRDDRAALL
jgi:hypothetical protein